MVVMSVLVFNQVGCSIQWWPPVKTGGNMLTVWGNWARTAMEPAMTKATATRSILAVVLLSRLRRWRGWDIGLDFDATMAKNWVFPGLL